MQKNVALRVRSARQAARLTQSELALRLRVSRSAVAQWENAAGSMPSAGHFAALAQVLGCTFEWLATGHGRRLAPGRDGSADRVPGRHPHEGAADPHGGPIPPIARTDTDARPRLAAPVTLDNRHPPGTLQAESLRTSGIPTDSVGRPHQDTAAGLQGSARAAPWPGMPDDGHPSATTADGSIPAVALRYFARDDEEERLFTAFRLLDALDRTAMLLLAETLSSRTRRPRRRIPRR